MSPHSHSDPSPAGPHSTTGRTVRRAGARGRFQLLTEGPGEPVQPRTDLAPGPAPDLSPDPAEPVLLRLLHLTDFQLADLASPARLEYLQALRGDGRWAAMLPSYRPQEFTATAQVEAMARTVRALAEAEGRPFDLVVTTGDNIDSQQGNELADFVALMTGGAEVHPLGRAAGGAVPTTGADPAAGELPVSARAAAGEPVPEWAVLPDAPVHPGGPAEWVLPFTATGVGAPWVACYGNHDALVQGRARATPELEALLSGAVKPTGPAAPGEINTAAGTGPAIDAYVRDPCCYSRPPALTRPSEPITADVRRRLVQREEFARTQRTHLADGGPGHGTQRGIAAPTAEPVCGDKTMCAVREGGVREGGVREGGVLPYLACRPHPAVTVLVLDTTNPGGYADGSIGSEQLRWLVGELTAAHSRYLTEDGTWRETGNPDRAVVLCSHHGLSTLTNGYVHRTGDGGAAVPGQDLPRSLAPDVEAVLARFPNVVLWLSGHIHRNRVRQVRTEVGGYWEVATSALVDWPCQARCLDFRLAGELLSIRCRQVDHRAAADPDREPDRVLRLAAIGRRLAANVFDGVGGPDAEGTELDRNVDLLVPITAALADRLRTATTTAAR
ncbi:MAG TPA: hypothetical protein VH141_22070 [Pseudonocardia sp.]|nr:hypothetical protein [Pseudonocardia sp.]